MCVSVHLEGKLTGVPHPLTASQPSCAGNPAVSHPIAVPLLISVNALNPPAYSQGLRNPSGGLPAAISASLTSVMTALAAGVAQLVPSSRTSVPFQATT